MEHGSLVDYISLPTQAGALSSLYLGKDISKAYCEGRGAMGTLDPPEEHPSDDLPGGGSTPAMTERPLATRDLRLPVFFPGMHGTRSTTSISDPVFHIYSIILLIAL